MAYDTTDEALSAVLVVFNPLDTLHRAKVGAKLPKVRVDVLCPIITTLLGM